MIIFSPAETRDGFLSIWPGSQVGNVGCERCIFTEHRRESRHLRRKQVLPAVFGQHGMAVSKPSSVAGKVHGQRGSYRMGAMVTVYLKIQLCSSLWPSKLELLSETLRIFSFCAYWFFTGSCGSVLGFFYFQLLQQKHCQFYVMWMASFC